MIDSADYSPDKPPIQPSQRTQPLRALLAAFALIALGFVVGYGFHTSQSVSDSAQNSTSTRPSPSPQSSPSPASPSGLSSPTASPPNVAPVGVAPPVVKGLRVSPDGRRVAFTGVYGNGQSAARFVFDLRSGEMNVRETPRGWQDFIVQWSSDSRKILFDREKIPRAVEEATPGLHEERFEYSNENKNPDSRRKTASQTPRSLTSGGVLPRGERSFSGLWTSSGELIVKTRREPKSLFMVRNGRAQILDRANGSYLQNRVVRESGSDVLYVVRDLADGNSALFRVQNGRARQISEVLRDVEWAYVAEGARWMVVCRAQTSSDDWLWTLYRIAPNRAQRTSTRSVPADVISVFWSPDDRAILGASGDSLWTIAVPSLQVKRIGARRDWNADDAGWIPRQNAAVIASRGVLWQVNTASGAARPLWKFPARYWGVS